MERQVGIDDNELLQARSGEGEGREKTWKLVLKLLMDRALSLVCYMFQNHIKRFCHWP